MISRDSKGFEGSFVGFTFNGVHTTSLGITRVSGSNMYSSNILPTFKDTTSEIPGGNGMYHWLTQDTQRQFNLNFAFDGITESQLRAIQYHFSQKDVADLIFDEYPYKVYSAKVQAPPQINYICFDDAEGRAIYRGTGTVNFICYYPYARNRFKNLDEVVSNFKNIQGWYKSAEINKSLGTQTPQQLFKDGTPVFYLKGTTSYGKIIKTGDLIHIETRFAQDVDSVKNVTDVIASSANKKTTHKTDFSATTGDYIGFYKVTIDNFLKKEGTMENTGKTSIRGNYSKKNPITTDDDFKFIEYYSFPIAWRISKYKENPVLFISLDQSNVDRVDFRIPLQESASGKYIVKEDTNNESPTYGRWVKEPFKYVETIYTDYVLDIYSESSSSSPFYFKIDAAGGHININDWAFTSGLLYRDDKRNKVATGDKTYWAFNGGDIDADPLCFIKPTNPNSQTFSAFTLDIKNYGTNVSYGKLNFKEMQLIGSDKMICVNTKNNLVLGCYQSNGTIVYSGNLYNKYISSGDFFKIPASKTGYYTEYTNKISEENLRNNTYLISITEKGNTAVFNDIQFNYLYY